MHPPEVKGDPGLPSLLGALVGLADPARREATARALARELAAEDLLLFARDPELDVLLPAPGLRQILREASAWRRFLDTCIVEGELIGEVPGIDGQPVRAWGCAHPEGGVAVVMGPEIRSPVPLRPFLPLFAALFRSERQVGSDEVRARSAAKAVERVRVVNAALQGARERLEEALAEAEEARMEADRASRAKSDFLAHMSHELRTPINAVIGYADLLVQGITGPVSEAQRVQLDRIRASSVHLLSLVNDVLDMAKVEAGEMTIRREMGALCDVAVEALALVELQAQKSGLQLDAGGLDEDTTYVGDPERLRQILVNFLSNAVKFTDPGGRITLECGTVDRAPPPTERVGGGPWAFVSVADTGVGIPADHLSRIFEPFVQVDSGHTRRREGTGLGLSLSHRLARLMEGDISVQSEEGVGSRFTLWLPTPGGEAGSADEDARAG